MAQWSFPFADNNGDRVYNDGDFSLFYENLFKSGVVATVGNALRITQQTGGGMQIVVKSGAAILRGRQYYNTEDLAVNVPVASATQDRVDSVVVRLDLGSRAITLAYKQGDVNVQRDESVFELQLATINIGRNTVNIFDANITDKRADETVSGYSSPYEKISVSGLEDQYQNMLQNAFESFKTTANDNMTELQQLLTNQQAIFQAWFSNLQTQLDTDAAGNLQNQLNKLTATENVLTITHNLGDYPNVMALYWEYGLGTVGLEEQPEGISFDGTAPETIPIKVIHLSRNQVQIKVPIDYAMTNPVVEAVSAKNINLTEGIKSMQIKLGVI